jgi:hypothetical protein
MAVYRIGNFLIAQTRKMCKYIFGDFYISSDINERERVFEIRLHKYLKIKDEKGFVKKVPIEDYVDIQAFKKFWGPQWRIMFDTFEEA